MTGSVGTGSREENALKQKTRASPHAHFPITTPLQPEALDGSPPK
jgi:hypothetical protein